MAWSREKKLAAYEALIRGTEGIERKGKATSYTSMNGNMFSFLAVNGDLAFRLSATARLAFLARHPKSVVVQYDTVMKDYVGVPDAILDDTVALKKLFAESVANARELKSKPTTSTKKTAKKAAKKKTAKKAAKKKTAKKAAKKRT